MSRKSRKDELKIRFEPRIRRNWGYWDGRFARKTNSWPMWCKPSQDFRLAHFDSAYGEGFFAGWYGEPHPNSGLVPGTPEFARYGD